MGSFSRAEPARRLAFEQVSNPFFATSAPVPDDRLRHVVAAEVSHADIVDRHLTLEHRLPASDVQITSTNMVGNGAAIPSTISLSLDREITLGKGESLRGTMPVGAGANVVLSLLYWDERLEK